MAESTNIEKPETWEDSGLWLNTKWWHNQEIPQRGLWRLSRQGLLLHSSPWSSILMLTSQASQWCCIERKGWAGAGDPSSSLKYLWNFLECKPRPRKEGLAGLGVISRVSSAYQAEGEAVRFDDLFHTEVVCSGKRTGPSTDPWGTSEIIWTTRTFRRLCRTQLQKIAPHWELVL